jgi:hypothetical protein
LEKQQHGLFVHVIWVAGRWMIAQGTNGLSRGDLTTGVMAGESMLSFVPLGRSVASVADRSPLLLPRLLEWLPAEKGSTWTHLSKQHWFD